VIRRTSKLILDIVGSALAGAAVLVALLLWRLAGEPVSLSFLTPHLQDALRTEDGSLRFELEDTVLTWAGWERTLEIRLVGVKVLGPEGNTLAAVPEVSVSLSTRAMLRGIVAPTSIDVRRPEINLLLFPAGDFKFDLSEGKLDNIFHWDIADFLVPPNKERPIGYLTRISIFDSLVVVDDQMLETIWRADNTDIIITRNETGVQGEITLDLDVSEMKEGMAAGEDFPSHQAAHLDLEFFYDTATGQLTPDGEDAQLHLKAVLKDFPFDGFKRYWPKSLAEPSRNWIINHLSQGAIHETQAAFSVHLPGGDFSAVDMKSITGKLKFTGLSVDFLSPMPPASKLEGTAIFSHNHIDFNVTSGHVGALSIENSTVNMWDLDTDIEKARVEAVVRGSARDLLTVLDEEPLGAARYLGIDPSQVKGEMVGRAMFSFPLRRDLDLPMVTISAAANLTDVTLPDMVLGEDMTQGDLAVKVTRDMMNVDGNAVFEDIPAQISGINHFTDNAPFVSRYTVKATMDEEARHRFDLDTHPYLTGPVDVELIWTELGGPKGDLSVVANLGSTSLNFGLLEWTKSPGFPGTAQASLSLEDQRLVKMRSFSITAEDLDVAGEAVFTPDGKGLQNITFKRLKTGRNDFTSIVEFRSDGGYDIALSGNVLDISHLFDRDEPDEKPLPPLAIELDVDRLWVKPEGVFNSVSGSLLNQNDAWRNLSLDANMGEEGHVALHLSPEGRMPSLRSSEDPLGASPIPSGTSSRLTVTSNDAGALLRRLGFYTDMEKGELKLSGKIDDSQIFRPFSGDLEIDDYHIVKAPVLMRLLTLADLTGIVDEIKGEGISFKKFSAPFTYENDLVNIRDGGAFGLSVGITFEGVLDLERNVSELDGTLVPAYTLNSIWGKIPILGKIVTGEEKGGGVFAVTFRARGPIDNPKISINPLAALTPGILRNLFEVFKIKGGLYRMFEGGSEHDGDQKDTTPFPRSSGNPFGTAPIPSDTTR